MSSRSSKKKKKSAIQTPHAASANRQETEKKGSDRERAGQVRGTRVLVPLYILATFLYLEYVFKLFTVQTTDRTGWLMTAGYACAFACAVSALLSLMPGRAGKIVLTLSEALICFVYTGQYVHYLFYSSFFSLFSVVNGTGQIAQFAGSILRIMMGHPYRVLALLAPFLLCLILAFIKKVRARACLPLFPAAAAAAALIAFLLPRQLDASDGRMYSPYNIYYNLNSPFYSVRYFGLAETMTADLYRYFTDFEETIVLEAPVAETDAEPVDTEREYNVQDIDLSAMAESASDSTLAEMHRYFASLKPTEKNDYTGIFEGKNLIYIMAESLCYGGIDPEMTPTLYKMATEGFNFTNYYTPIYYASTFDGEYMTLLSLLPKENVWSLYAARRNELPYSYGNAFGKLGYRTEAYHGYTYTYYHRNLSHPNLGYKWNAVGNGLNVRMVWPPSDVEVVEKSAYRYMSDSPFMIYYMSISGHLAYNFGGNAMAVKHKSEVTGLPYSKAVQAYYACQREFDDSLALLVSDLEQQGILDDTVFVITNDHYPYGLKTGEMEEFCDYIEDEKFDIHKGVFIVYNSATEGEQVDKVCSNLDALPTVSNMFGLEYDSRLMMGRDVMSDAETMAIFSDRSWITSSGSYDAETQTFRKSRLAEIPADYVESMNNQVYYKFLMSRYILDKDYYDVVF